MVIPAKKNWPTAYGDDIAGSALTTAATDSALCCRNEGDRTLFQGSRSAAAVTVIVSE
jgi:hypothetical protein